MRRDGNQAQRARIPKQGKKPVKRNRRRMKLRKHTRPTLQPGTVPGPPTSAAPMLETMAPYKFGITITSNWPGLATSCIDLYTISEGNCDRKRHASLRVVYDHVICGDARSLVLLCYLPESVEEETVAELHDVRFVDACYFL